MNSSLFSSGARLVKIVDCGERLSTHNRLSVAQAAYIVQSQPNLKILDRTDAPGTIDIHRQHAQTMALGVFDKGGGMIEAHRLIVEGSGGKSSEVMTL